jgi:tetrapyrrole methylase family protein/MazG family protein
MHLTIASMNAAGNMNEAVLEKARHASRVVLQTKLGQALDRAGVAYETLDSLYESADDFDILAEAACEKLVQDDTLFIVLGDICRNIIAAKAVKRVIQNGGTVSVIPDGSAALCAAFAAGIADGTRGVTIFTASAFTQIWDTDVVVVIDEIDSRLKASELKLSLSRVYDDEHSVFLADTRSNDGKIIPLCLLDAEPSYGYYTSVVLPSCSLERKRRYTFADLVTVMEKLRSRNGCPWDKEQTHESLKRYLVEESYEVLEAIDDGDTDALYDELGDVLLQVVFHARIAQQQGEFDILDVTTAICAKMISRHTHIFGSAVADSPDAVIKNWEQIKKGEKGQKSQTEVLQGVPKSMPALMRSGKVQHKAAHVGFDFTEAEQAFEKLREEIEEVRQSEDKDALADECGDLLFSAVNVVRMLGIEPETALQKATDKFIARFAIVERLAKEQDIDMKTCGIVKLDELWDQAKLEIDGKKRFR